MKSLKIQGHKLSCGETDCRRSAFFTRYILPEKPELGKICLCREHAQYYDYFDGLTEEQKQYEPVFGTRRCFVWQSCRVIDEIFDKMEKGPDRYSELPDVGKEIEDPLPPHDPDGYWSGNKEDTYIKDPDSMNYAEGVEDIIRMCDANAEYPYSAHTDNAGTFKIVDRTDMELYIGDMTKNLIHKDGDNYIRFVVLNYPHTYKDAKGAFLVRCGDCGKIAQGRFNGNPDMGDPAYQTYHRKNWFCKHYMWTYMGGHGYPGGRRMICPDCSNEYAVGNRKIPGNRGRGE